MIRAQRCYRMMVLRSAGPPIARSANSVDRQHNPFLKTTLRHDLGGKYDRGAAAVVDIGHKANALCPVSSHARIPLMLVNLKVAIMSVTCSRTAHCPPALNFAPYLRYVNRVRSAFFGSDERPPEKLLRSRFGSAMDRRGWKHLDGSTCQRCPRSRHRKNTCNRF